MKKLTAILILAISLFGFNSISNKNIQNYPTPTIEGKVIKAYTDRGFGRMGYEWLFMDVQTKNGVVTVAIAPTFRIPNLPINEGDEVKVYGFTPPIFPENVIKATDIYDITQKRDYPIWGGGYGPHGGWYRGDYYHHYEPYHHNEPYHY